MLDWRAVFTSLLYELVSTGRNESISRRFFLSNRRADDVIGQDAALVPARIDGAARSGGPLGQPLPAGSASRAEAVVAVATGARDAQLPEGVRRQEPVQRLPVPVRRDAHRHLSDAVVRSAQQIHAAQGTL